MRNLEHARSNHEVLKEYLVEELEEAKVKDYLSFSPVLEPTGMDDIPVPVIGWLQYDSGQLVAFVRKNTYWEVHSVKGLQYDVALTLNDHYHQSIRLNGASQGIHPTEFEQYVSREMTVLRGAKHWEVDTAEGLKELVKAFHTISGKCDINRFSARQIANMPYSLLPPSTTEAFRAAMR